jgi:hypothetical protein
MLLKERIERIEGLNEERSKLDKQIAKELKELKKHTRETFEKIHEDAVPELPFMRNYNAETQKEKDVLQSESL